MHHHEYVGGDSLRCNRYGAQVCIPWQVLCVAETAQWVCCSLERLLRIHKLCPWGLS